MAQFLPEKEQRLYDSMVDGLRRGGWLRVDAEDEALERILKMRNQSKLSALNSWRSVMR